MASTLADRVRAQRDEARIEVITEFEQDALVAWDDAALLLELARRAKRRGDALARRARLVRRYGLVEMAAGPSQAPVGP